MKLLVIDEHPIVLQGGQELLSRGITDILQTHDLAVGWALIPQGVSRGNDC